MIGRFVTQTYKRALIMRNKPTNHHSFNVILPFAIDTKCHGLTWACAAGAAFNF